MRNRDVLDLNLRAFGQHLLGVDIFLLTPRRCWGAALKPKSSTMRFHIYKEAPKGFSRSVIKPKSMLSKLSQRERVLIKPFGALNKNTECFRKKDYQKHSVSWLRKLN